MDTSRLLPPGREQPTPEDAARLPVTALLLACLAPRFKRLTGWMGLAHCPGDSGAWTCRLAVRPGVFGCLREAWWEEGDRLNAAFSLHYFPHQEEPLFDRFSVAAEVAVVAQEYTTRVRNFPAAPDMRTLFQVGRVTLGLDRSRRGLVFRLEALERDVVLLPEGLGGDGGWIVPPGGAEQDLPAWDLARDLFHAVAGALTFGLGLPPGLLVRSELPGSLRIRQADGAVHVDGVGAPLLHGEGLAWGNAAREDSPALALPGAAARRAWSPGDGLPDDVRDAPCWQAHDLENATIGPDGVAAADRRPALVVLAGFLGAGKTSLLLEMLEHHRAHDQFVAVIQNELGATGVDGRLIDGDESVVSLDEGCVCCTLAGSLAAGVKRLTERFHPERIILETSGLANPLNLLAEQESWAGLARLEMIVTVVDAAHGLDMLAASDIARDQARCGDILVVNKCDLAGTATLRDLRSRLRELNPRAPILETTRGRVHPGLFFEEDNGENGVPGKARPRPPVLRRRNHLDEAFGSVRVPQPKGLTLAALRRSMQCIPDTVFRVKGLLRLADVREPQVLQGVGRRVELSPLEHPFTDEPFLVFIGRHLDTMALMRFWEE